MVIVVLATCRQKVEQRGSSQITVSEKDQFFDGLISVHTDPVTESLAAIVLIDRLHQETAGHTRQPWTAGLILDEGSPENAAATRVS